MRKIFYTIMACLAFVALPSCNEEDDIRKDMDALKDRLEKLAPKIDAVNTQIENYYDMVTGNVYISSYQKLDNGDYIVKLSNGDEMKVFGGKPSEEVPVVSINEKGFWCYTVNGETAFMYDSEGKPLIAIPENGPAGKTPKVSVDEQGFWVYSIDEGKTWTPMGGDAANPQKMTGGLFSGVKLSADGSAMEFQLAAGGDPVIVPLYTNMNLTFAYAEGQTALSLAKGAIATIQATVTKVETIIIEDTPLQVSIDETGLTKVFAPATLAAGSYTVYFRIVDAGHYAMLKQLNVEVTNN